MDGFRELWPRGRRLAVAQKPAEFGTWIWPPLAAVTDFGYRDSWNWRSRQV